MATKQQLQTLDKYVDAIHEMLIDHVRGIRQSSTRQITKSRFLYARMYGQLLYEAPKLFTGQVSIEMVDRKLHDFSAKPCPEHYLSRQKGGEALVALIDMAIQTSIDPPRALVQNIVMAHCAVHYTTPEENATLKKFQRRHFDEAAYKEAGILLIEARDLFTQKRHTDKWRHAMIRKYSPIVEHHLTSVGLVQDNQPIEDQ